MKILVTGGAGYIGSFLIKKLIENKHDVISIDNLSRGDYNYLNKYRENPNLKLVVGDICDSEKLDDVIKESGGIDAIAHLAAIPGLERCEKNPKVAILTNIYGTYNILEAARRYEINKIVFTSSAAVYGKPLKTPLSEDHPLNPTNLYGVTKLTAENLMKMYHNSYGLNTVILRFGNVYGIGLYTHWETVIPKFIKQALEGQPLTIYGDGNQSRDFIHIWDVVRAIQLVLEAKDSIVAGEVFNIGTGKSTSVNTIVDVISRVFIKYGRTVTAIHLPFRKGEPYTQDFCLSSINIKNKLQFYTQRTIEDGIEELLKTTVEILNNS